MPWSPLLLTGQSFTNKTIGFLGFGRIAQATLVVRLFTRYSANTDGKAEDDGLLA